MSDLVVASGNAAMVQASWTQEQLDLIKSQICKPKERPATDEELGLFIATAQRMGLDPISREIYAVFRRDSGRERMTIQVGIDGYRKAAERTGEYQGQLGPWWCGPDGEWKEVWLASEPPSAAKVGVFRRGFRKPLYAVARWDAYCQVTFRNGNRVPADMWARMGDNQLAKCAEALALRRAFPGHFHGVYTKEEMAQADNDREERPSPLPMLERPAQKVEPMSKVIDVEFSEEEKVGVKIDEAQTEEQVFALKAEVDRLAAGDREHWLRQKAKSRIRTLRGAA